MVERTVLWNAPRGGWDVGRLFETNTPLPLPPVAPPVNEPRPRGNLFSHCLCKEEVRNLQEFCTCSYLAASSLLTFLICEEIMIER